jgi:hypothetical protein
MRSWFDPIRPCWLAVALAPTAALGTELPTLNARSSVCNCRVKRTMEVGRRKLGSAQRSDPGQDEIA